MKIKKQIKVRIIECGMNLTLKVKDVQFVNHNNRTAARSYIDLCNKLSKTFRDKYTDKHYIKIIGLLISLLLMI